MVVLGVVVCVPGAVVVFPGMLVVVVPLPVLVVVLQAAKDKLNITAIINSINFFIPYSS